MELKDFNTAEIEKIIEYEFKNKELLLQAFTRRSYQNEHTESEHNELLEFIGDSVIGMSVVKFITNYYKIYRFDETSEETKNSLSEKGLLCFLRYGSVLDEAELSELKIQFVQRSSLAYATERLGLEKHLIMSEGDKKNNIQNEAKVKEDLFEAIIGAIAIDSGWDMFLLDNLVVKLLDIENRLENGSPEEPDYVKMLNDWFFEHGYKCDFKEKEHASNMKYCCSIDLGPKMLNNYELGYGNTLYGAQRMAAKRALKYIEKSNKRAKIIAEIIEKPNPKRAVNQLNELFQKKIISEPKYDFTDQGNSWQCYCSVDDAYSDCCIAEKKMDAKQMAASSLLKVLLSNFRGPESISVLKNTNHS